MDENQPAFLIGCSVQDLNSMKVIATFVRTVWVCVGKEPQVTEWRLPGGHFDLQRVLGPKYLGDFYNRLVQNKRAEILQSNSSVVWELFEKEINIRDH
jgi:hypothetical protein